jgi:hypothetical protein
MIFELVFGSILDHPHSSYFIFLIKMEYSYMVITILSLIQLSLALVILYISPLSQLLTRGPTRHSLSFSLPFPPPPSNPFPHFLSPLLPPPPPLLLRWGRSICTAPWRHGAGQADLLAGVLGATLAAAEPPLLQRRSGRGAAQAGPAAPAPPVLPLVARTLLCRRSAAEARPSDVGAGCPSTLGCGAEEWGWEAPVAWSGRKRRPTTGSESLPWRDLRVGGGGELRHARRSGGGLERAAAREPQIDKLRRRIELSPVQIPSRVDRRRCWSKAGGP